MQREAFQSSRDATSSLNSMQQQIKSNLKTSEETSDEVRHIQTKLSSYSPSSLKSLLDEYKTSTKDRREIIKSYQDTMSDGDSYLGQNTNFASSNAIGYVTEQGVFKTYGEDSSVLNSVSGQNGCPDASQFVTNESGIIYPYSQGSTSENTGNIALTVGSPMQLNQSCGNEGKNVFVDSLTKNPTSSFLGVYYDSLETPSISFIDNGNKSYTFDTCMQAAANYNSPYFSLQGADTTNTSEQRVQCGLSSDVTSAMQNGVANSTPCRPGSDGANYGCPNCVFLYETSTADNIGCFQMNANQQTNMNLLLSNTDYATCKTTAANQNISFFALGPQMSNGANCYGSNSISEATMGGLCQSSVTIDGQPYGAEGINAIYKMTSQSYPQNFGTTWYIDENTLSYPYDPTNITTSSTAPYTQSKSFDIGINNQSLQTIAGSSVSDCQAACSNNPECVAITMDTASNCNLYPSSALDMTTPKPNGQINYGVATYLQIPTVINNSSCKKDVKTVDSVRLQNYVPSGQVMTPDMECGLGKRISRQNKQIDHLEKTMSDKISSMVSALTSSYNFSEGFDGGFRSTVDANSATARQAIQQLEDLSPEDIRNLDISEDMVNVSSIQVVQKNTMLTIWCIVGVLFFLLAIMLVYNTTKKE
jgi:PAN domain